MISHHYLHTGQRTCHADDGHEVPCESSGQDASFDVGTPWPEPLFEILHAGVLDRLTRLLWRRSANLTPQPVLWREALAAVAGLNREGADFIWRLPTINELEALVDCAAHSRPCRPCTPSSTCRIFTGRLPPACSSPIGLGPCIWKKVRRASDKNDSHNFRYGPWQLSIEFIS